MTQNNINLEFELDNIITKPTQPISKFLDKHVDKSYYIHQPSMIRAIILNKIQLIDTHCGTITTKQLRWNNAGYVMDKDGCRMLTPCETLKLMGFTQQDFDKVKHIGKCPLWKVSGNSIVVDVLESIFEQLIKT